MFFGAGEYRPGTPAGDRLLAHELVHTVDPQADPDALYRQPQTGGVYDLLPDAIRAIVRQAFRVEVRLARSDLANVVAAVDVAERQTVAGLTATLPTVVSSSVGGVVHLYADSVRSVINAADSVLKGEQELSTVDIDGILDDAGLQADWLALTERRRRASSTSSGAIW